MATMDQVVLQNVGGVGFSIEALETLRSLPKVVQVDGRKLRDNGCFAEVVIFFDEPGLADRFLQTALEFFGDEIERVE